MKYLVTLLLFSLNAFAVDCNQIREDLLVLENNLLSGKMPQCGSEGAQPEPYCCNSEKPYSCKSRRQLELEYNAAVGELIIAEGIVALGMSIESNHNAMVNIPSGRLNEITRYSSELDKNIQTADLLFDAMELVENGSQTMWSNYRGSSRADMSLYVADLCINDTYKDTTFCQRVNANAMADNPDEDLHAHWMETLNGFINADKRSEPVDSDRERINRFQTYQEKLSIKVDNDLLTPQQYLDSEVYAKVKSLKENIDFYREKRNSEEHKEEAARIASEILQTSNQLDSIKVNYADSSTASQTVGRFISENFDSVMTQMDMPDLILTDPVTQNFQQTHAMFENDLKRFSQSINKRVEEVLYQQRSRDAGAGRTIEQICNGNYNIDCLRSVCGEGNCQQSSIRDLNLTEFLNEANELAAQRDVKMQLSQAKGCMENDNYETTAQKRACLRGIAEGLDQITSTELDEMREKVKGLDYLISRQNHTQPFQNLNIEKAMAVHLLKSEACQVSSNDLLIVRRNYCQETPRESDISFGSNRNVESEYVTLMAQGEEVVINMNHSAIRGALEGQGAMVTDEQRNALKEQCAQNEVRSQSICQFYREEAAHQESIRIARERDAEILRADEREQRRLRRIAAAEERSLAGEMATGAGQELLLWSPLLIGAYVEGSQVRDEQRAMRAGIRQYDTWYMENLPHWQQYYDNLYSGSVSNWGYQFGQQIEFQPATTFQSANVNTNFSNNSGMQFNYAPIPTTIDTSVRTPAASGGSDTFGFGF